MLNLGSYGKITISITRRELLGRHRSVSKASLIEGALHIGKEKKGPSKCTTEGRLWEMVSQQ